MPDDHANASLKLKQILAAQKSLLSSHKKSGSSVSLENPGLNILQNKEDDDGGDSGNLGGVIIEKRLFTELFSLIRAGEAEFGIVPPFDPMAYLADAANNQTQFGDKAGQALKNHPILSQLSKFAGVSPKDALPADNPEAQRSYELQLNLRLGLSNSPASTPKLAKT